MGLASRLVTGDGIRRSRLHNYKGRLIDLGGLCYAPHALLSAILQKLFNYRPEVPWLGYRAIRRLQGLIQKDWKVLEFGSGMSSLWFARRCALLVSKEHDEAWYRTLSRRFAELGITNIDYRFSGPEDYPALDNYPDQFFDFVLVDGIRRDEAAATAVRKVKPGGYVYLDNSDVAWQEYRLAEERLLRAAGSAARVQYFNDFYPTQLAVSEGLLIRKPASTTA
jgi:predicted O-methyltransferase YrrM